MGPREFFLIAVIFLVLAFILFPNRQKSKSTIVKIGNATVTAEVADNDIKRIKGLMFRKSLPEFEGMLFVFGKEDYYGIWMLNMSFPIDIIWINADKTVVDIVKNAQPCRIICDTYRPKEKAQFVLEVNANFTEKYGIDIGSSVEFTI
jgi:hypothetical protein